MNIAKDKVVSIHYTLKNDAGSVIESCEGAEALVYLHGAQNIIPGLERALEGKVADDALEVCIEAVDAYGEYNKELTEVVPSRMFEGVDRLEVGMEFQAETEQGVQVIWIVNVNGNDITIDGNHPLAGERLHYDVTVDAVRDASAEELEHGHIHTEGSCH